MIESYKHYAGKPDLELGSLMYDGVEYLPYVIVKNVTHKRLQKHFFYFHHDIPEDARSIDELLTFIDGESLDAASSSSPAAPTPRIKKKRRKNKVSVSANNLANQPRVKTDSISEEASTPVDDDNEPPTQDEAATGVTSETSEQAVPYKLEKSSTEQMKKIWKEFTERNQGQRQIFEASREFDFDITEEEGGPHDMTLEKADYLDKLTNMIAAKAQAEWENKMKGFEKLQEENEDIQTKIKEKEREFDKHKDKVTEMIDNQAKAMTNYISVISKTEDERAENVKEIKKLETEITDLEAKILKIKEEQKVLNGKCHQCDVQIDKMEKKRKKLEKYMETEMRKVKQEGEDITSDIDKLNEELKANIKATEDLARMDIAPKTETSQAGASGGGGVTNTNERLITFLTKSIKEKEADLECPVCMETAEAPIFMCQEMHLICSNCRPKVFVNYYLSLINYSFIN